MNDLRNRLLAAFRQEQAGYVGGIRVALARLESGAAVPAADVDEAFRLAHSLRAAARVCDFPTVEAIGGRFEAFFAQARSGAPRPGKDVLDGLREALDAVEEWGREDLPGPEPAGALAVLDRLLAGPALKPKPEAPGGELAPRLLAAFQVEHKEHLEGMRAILAGVEHGISPPEVDEIFRRAHSLKGAARLAGLPSLSEMAHHLESMFAKVRGGTLRLDAETARVINSALDAIEDGAAACLAGAVAPDPAPVLAAIERVVIGGGRGVTRELAVPASDTAVAVPRAAPPEVPGPFPAAESVRVEHDNLDRLLRSTGQILTETQRQGAVDRELNDLGGQIDRLVKDWDAYRRAAPAAGAEATAAEARAARLMTTFDEQLRAAARKARAVRRTSHRGLCTLRLLGGQLLRDLSRVRMVTAESVFQGFRKMVRDLAHGEGKEVDFRLEGQEIQADRAVLQSLKDPLMHALCNAVTHGIEPPGDRRGAGKPSAGRLTLSLEAVGNRLSVRVVDDGRGIDRRKVAAAAVRSGFLSEEDADGPADEVARLIFRPGISTAEAVTGVSGRGMGLSVLYEAVARLQGEVGLPPVDGPGTCIAISVPVSVSAQRMLLISCRGQIFAMPVHALVRLLGVKPREVESVEGHPTLLFRGQPLPLVSLAHLLDMEETEATGATLAVMVVRSGARRVAVAVDAFLAERDGLVMDLDDPARQVRKLSGGILLEDGSIALVLNPAELLKTSRPRGHAPARKAPPKPAPAARRVPTVLVVDDSLTTRTLEKSILEAHGYTVRLAVDGLQALAMLRAEPADLVITDIEMPHMDGFRLLAEMKKDRRLADTPVIVVTSLGRPEDQEKGLSLGADAYIVKQKFDHEELLETIRQIL